MPKKLVEYLSEVQDVETFEAFKTALSQVEDSELKPQATTTAKALLNIALEQIVQPLLGNVEISYDSARFKLTAMDLLLCRGALKTPNHETGQFLDAFNKKAAHLYNKLSSERDDQEPLSILTPTEQVFLTVFYWVKSSFDILKRIHVLRQVVLTLKENGKPRHRPIIVCETHDDKGAFKLLTGLNDYLATGYSILIEEAYNLPPKQIVEIWANIFQADDQRSNRANIINFATQDAFVNKTRFIDPMLDPTPDFAAMKLHGFVQRKMLSMTSMALRDEGLYLEILRSIYQGERVTAVLGALHGNVIVRKLETDDGINCIPVMPFVDHTKMHLIKNENGGFRAEPKFYFLNALITELRCEVMDLSKPEAQIFKNFLL